MAPRSYWKGYLKLSLVSCAVALYPSVSRSDRVSFNWVNRETGNRLRQLMVDSETEEPVERDERVRGFQLSKSEYLPIEESDLEAIEVESSHTIDIENFVPRSEIDPVYLDSSYYLVPNDKVAEEAFAVIRDAMASEGVAGLGRAVISRRERLLVMEPRDKGILVTMLHYNCEVRDSSAYFDSIPDIEIPSEMVDLAKHIIRTKMGHFDITKFEDRYENALIQMIRDKQAGRPVEAAKPHAPGKVINLMDALRRSIATEKGGLKDPEAAEKGNGSGARPRRSAKEGMARKVGQSRSGPSSPEGEPDEKARPPARARGRPERKASGR